MTGPDLEDRLREALYTRAVQVQPAPDALPTIRSRIAARRGRRRHLLLAGVATVATSLAAVLGVAIVGELAGPASGPHQAASAGPTTPSSSVPDTTRLPVYWVGADRGAKPSRDVLYREFRTLPVTTGTLADRVSAAVTEAVSGAPLDPDYRSGWPAGVTVRGVQVGASTVTVDLTGLAVDATNPAGAAAVRQLVWTVTAVSDRPGVRLRVDGRAVDALWSQVPVGGTLSRAEADKVLAPVWLITPQQSDTVGTSFDVQVAGFLPDGRVRIELRDSAGALVVSETATMDDTSPHQGEATVRIDLPAGGYSAGPATLIAVPAGSTQVSIDDHVITLPG